MERDLSNEKYRFLFPYEKVSPGARVLIYGAGLVGIEYLKQIMITHYCEVVGMVDRNYAEYPAMVVPIYAPADISKLEFDNIIIALKSGIYVDEIKDVLFSQGVNQKQIISSFERDTNFSVSGTRKQKELSVALAYKKSKISIALLVSGGIGDMVIQKRFVSEIIKIAPTCQIDIYCPGGGDFLRYLYMKCRNINAVILDLGSRYTEQVEKYVLGIEMVSTRYIHVNMFNKEELEEQNKNLAERMQKLREESQIEDFNHNTLLYAIYQRRLYNKFNAYTALGYNGAFEIYDKKVDIPLVKKADKKFKELELGRYITLNYGNATVKEAKKVAKMWPYEYFVKMVAMFKEKYSGINVVQVSGGRTTKIEGIHCFLQDKEFELVAHILKNAIFHIDIEGGLVHIASQLGTKCFVLFGPTSREYFGYDDNVNIIAGTCHNCCGLYRDLYICARGMDEPECMYSITPEYVMERICRYMDSIR